MNKRFMASVCLLSILLLPALAFAADTKIERIEPAFWWVGMKSEKLQLMVHGSDIAELSPQLSYPGVSVESVTRVANKNYLFVDLRIKPDTAAGKFELVFTRGALTIRYPYELLAREKNSVNRVGFNSSDAILLIVPDRFANGDAANDRVAGFPDKLDRCNPSARHGGDIQGIIDHLDYIAAMGYTELWPTPLVENNQPDYSYHGYAATDTYKIDARFGSNADYKRMVAIARQKGIGVIQDIVLNHIGSSHWWMKDMPMKDWLSYDGKYVPTYHARTAVNDPYASKEDKKNFVAGWFSKNMPDMNQKNALVATYQIQNTIWWIEYAGLSGIRADTYGYSDSAFLTEWSRRVMDEYPHFNIVGEEWSANPVVVSYWQRGKKNHDGYVSYLPSLMDFPLNESLRNALVADEDWNGGLKALYEKLANDYLYPDPSNLVLFEGNHDMSRLFSALNEDIGLDKMALAYVLTMRGIPQLYYGTEILMTGPKVRDDGAIRNDFPGGWAGDKVNAFTGAGLTAQQKDAQAFLKKLLNWRKSQPVIHSGKVMHYAPDHGTYVYFRYDGTSKVMVVLNKNKSAAVLATDRFHEMLTKSSSATDVMTGRRFDLGSTLSVPARSVLILEVK